MPAISNILGVAQNWLQRIAGKEEYLFSKYQKQFQKNFRGTDAADGALRETIQKAVNWSRKYSEWYVYQTLQHISKSGGFKNFPEWQIVGRELSEARDYLQHGGSIPSIKTPPEELFEASDNWHRMMAAKGEGKEYQTSDVWTQLSNGWSLVNVTGKNDLEVEGHLMGHCFAPESLVRTIRGFERIDCIKSGDLVLTEDGSFRKVTRAFKRTYRGKMVKLHTRLGITPVRVTPQHQFHSLLPLHSGNKPCRLHTCGSLCRGNQPDDKHMIGWKKIGELDTNSYLHSMVPRETFDLDVISVPEEYVVRGNAMVFDVDEDFLWMVGLYVAEGSNDGDKLSFALSKTEQLYADRIIAYFRKYGLNSTERKEKLGYGGLVIRVNSRMLCRWFSDWIGKGCDNKKVPIELLNLPNHKVSALLKGIFDGDGCYAGNCLHQTSPMIALQCMEMSMRLGGIPSTSIRDNSSRNRKISYMTEGVLTRDKTFRRKRNFWQHKGHLLVKPIEYGFEPYSGFVYNLEVDDIHSYVVQHLVVHNCVGSYCEETEAGTNILSLRDPNNLPHVTFEINQQEKLGEDRGSVPPPKVPTGYYIIDQIKGKENKPQPKYAPQVSEAVEKLTERFQFTLSEEGMYDLLGWYPDDPESQTKILEKIREQKDVEHEHSGFAAHDFARYGPTGDELYSHLQSGEADNLKERRFAYNVKQYLDWLIAREHNDDMRLELVNKLEQLRNYFIEEDPDYDAGMTEEDFAEIVSGIEKGTIDWDGMSSSLTQWMVQQSEAYWQSDYDVDEFLVEEEEEKVAEDYIATVTEEDTQIPDLDETYQAWKNYYDKKKRDEKRQQHFSRIEQVMQQYGIVIPPEADEDLVRQRFHGYLFAHESDQQWATHMQEIIDSNVRANQQWDREQQSIQQRINEWAPQLGQIVPNFTLLDEFGQRECIARFMNKDAIDQEVINYATLYTQNNLQPAVA